jgi:hypothetical protein
MPLLADATRPQSGDAAAGIAPAASTACPAGRRERGSW